MFTNIALGAVYIVMAVLCFYGGIVGMFGRWDMDDWNVWINAKIVGFALMIVFVVLVAHSFNLVFNLDC